jgi:hypothetical protein
MQYLMVILVMGSVILFAIAVLLGVSYAIGVYLNSRGAAHEPDPGAQFQADRDWYEELPIWKRNVVTAWWLVNRYQCASRGYNK